jgi:mediator of replication checkpoint protein 1
LYKDVHNGGLRRKRGNDFDLSDAEDEAEERRRRKQQQYKKMRQALFADERIGEIGTYICSS